jgi:hypothetical protein
MKYRGIGFVCKRFPTPPDFNNLKHRGGDNTHEKVYRNLPPGINQILIKTRGNGTPRLNFAASRKIASFEKQRQRCRDFLKTQQLRLHFVQSVKFCTKTAF